MTPDAALVMASEEVNSSERAPNTIVRALVDSPALTARKREEAIAVRPGSALSSPRRSRLRAEKGRGVTSWQSPHHFRMQHLRTRQSKHLPVWPNCLRSPRQKLQLRRSTSFRQLALRYPNKLCLCPSRRACRTGCSPLSDFGFELLDDAAPVGGFVVFARRILYIGVARPTCSRAALVLVARWRTSRQMLPHSHGCYRPIISLGAYGEPS